MFWFIAMLVIMVGIPLLLFSLTALALEIGLTATVVGGFVLLILAGAVSMPAVISLVITCGIVWLVCKGLMKSVKADEAES